MEREALKLALEELADRFSEGWHEGIKIDASDIMLLSEAAQALAQPAQEPVALVIDSVIVKFVLPEKYTGHLYTTPPQRPWVGLTDEMIEYLFQSAAGADEETHIRFARAIESELRSKNT
tara:strand:- start:406 stop:765 length:360 start_codon:yes stop_codon:yes gene_type:complete